MISQNWIRSLMQNIPFFSNIMKIKEKQLKLEKQRSKDIKDIKTLLHKIEKRLRE